MPDKTLIEMAGVYYVAAELSRRGMIALLTMRKTPAYDIIAATTDGRKHANIQVKTSLNRATFFLTRPSEHIRCGRADYYVLVRWLRASQCFECFLLTGAEAQQAVALEEKSQKGRIKRGTRRKLRPSIHVAGKAKESSAEWKKKWQSWKL